jgi:hypothetical protein
MYVCMYVCMYVRVCMRGEPQFSPSTAIITDLLCFPFDYPVIIPHFELNVGLYLWGLVLCNFFICGHFRVIPWEAFSPNKEGLIPRLLQDGVLTKTIRM